MKKVWNQRAVRAAAVFALQELETRRLLSLTGSVFTTDVADLHNRNIYTDKPDVYIDANQNLPDGAYYVRVTSPDGSVVLGTSISNDGNPNNDQPFVVSGGVSNVPELTGILWKGSDNTQHGFDDTPSPGGEYKVWVSTDANFSDDNSKTDNFKVRHSSGPSVGGIFGDKFEDLNGNGVRDAGEPGLGGFNVYLDLDNSGTLTPGEPTDITSNLGHYSFLVAPGTYRVREDTPPTGWKQTTADLPDVTAVADQDVFGGDIGNFHLGVISGEKFCDANTNGHLDAGEHGVDGITVFLDTNGDGKLEAGEESTVTANGGQYSFNDLFIGTYKVREVLPSGWVQTTPNPGDIAVTHSGQSFSGILIGNVQLGAGGGHTLGFWSNKNGEAKINDNGGAGPELLMLRNLNLRDAAGNNFDPTTYTQLRNWLLNATATNMAYMLSAQLAAMALNVEAGYVIGSALIYAPGANPSNAAGFTTVQALINEANADLLTHNKTVTSGASRSYQEILKNALDAANNNLNFVIC